MQSKEIYIPFNGAWHRVDYQDIVLIESDNRYCKITTVRTTLVYETSLANLEDKLGDGDFCRVHRSYIVPLKRIHHFNREIINLGDREVPIGKQYATHFMSRLKLAK